MLVGLTQFGLLEFSGADAQVFLHAQLSCDVGTLEPGHARYGSYNTPKGRMLATFLLWRADSAFYMQLARDLCEPVRKRLSMYVLRSKVKAVDVSAEYALLGVAGEQAEPVLKGLFGQIPVAPLTLAAGRDETLLRLDGSRFQVVAAPARSEELRQAIGRSIAPADPAAWDWLDI